MWYVTREEGHDLKHPVRSRDWDEKNKPNLRKKLRMCDGDGNIIYEGWADRECFAPLDDYGEPNFGCCEIQYYNSVTGKWETL